MSFLEILLLILFFVLPLIQQVLEQRKRGSAPPPEPGERPEAPHPLPERQTPTVALPRVPGEEVPPVEWNPWPTTLEEVAREEVADERQADELARAQRRMSPELAPEELRVSVPVVSLEPLTVDRAAEHRRLHDRAHSVPVVRRTERSPLASFLRDREQLQRAVLISELLGPPRSLQ